MGRKRGSYRTIRRFFETPLPWPSLLWEFFHVHCLDPNQVYLLAGDETVVSKAGKQTHGIGRFFSSLSDQPIRGLSFFCLSLVSVESSTAWPLRLAQLLPRHKKRQTPPSAGQPEAQAAEQSSHQQAHVILFSSDVALGYHSIVEYYALRFQIEFVFRDAKQFWGLEDVMNRTERGVTNAATLAFFIVMLAQRLLMALKPAWPEVSILDLKAWFRGDRYAEEVLKYLPEKLDPILSASIFSNIVNLGAIHPFPAADDPL